MSESVGKKYRVKVKYVDGKTETLELVWDNRKGAWKLQKPGLLGAKFITLVASMDNMTIKHALEAALGKGVASVSLL